jgi:hypothetical protein
MFFCVAVMSNACNPQETIPPDISGIVSGKICYPSDYLPALTLYFESTADDRGISYQTHEGQSSYAVELEPGSYYAYAWLPEDILGGGMYSEAVPCGLRIDCTDHNLIPVIVEPKQETIGVDICDWYAPLGQVPLPPGKIEGMIAAFLSEQHPDLASDFEPVLQEMNMQGDVLKRLSARVFRITEGLFENESFLITHNGKVVQLGTAVGGQGISSMELSDLDQDGQAELYFTYSFGSGTHQTHLGVYSPAYAPEKIYEANTYYLGDLMLFSDQQHQVGVRIVEHDPGTNTVHFQEILGQLILEKNGLDPVLKLEFVDDLPEEIKKSIVQPGAHLSSIAAENPGTEIMITGIVKDVSLSARLITLKDQVEGFSVLALTENCELKSSNGEEIDLHDIQPGMTVQVSGQPGASEALLTSFVLGP